MAKGTVKPEYLTLDITVNANKSQKQINDLGREITDTTFKVKELKNQQLELVKAGQKNSEEYKTLGKEIKDNQNKIKALKEEQQKLINGLDMELKTIGQLKKQLADLKRLRDASIPNSEQYNKYQKEIEAVSNRLHELRVGAEQAGNGILKLANKLNQYISVLVAGGASFTAFWTGVKKARDEYAHFDDVLSDVMKTTNLSKEAVKELNAELEKIDTRTNQEDLLGLGRIAGKLGYNDPKQIVEFVKANNELVVALNEDLGGNVEETVNKIGKLVDVFKLKDIYTTEEAFKKVGSAINELGAAGTANEAYMVEFARRMAGIAPLANVSIDKILGLAATLDQLGQSEEVSTTALSKLWVKMASDADTYSKYAGMQVTDFKNLLEKDFMGAFTKVLQGVKQSSGGINALAATLGDLGEDSGRVIGVLGSLADNVDMLSASMELSNRAMIEGTSLTTEYNTKNQNAAAQLDKARKEVSKFWRELGEKLWPALTAGNNILTMFIKTMGVLITFIANNIGKISTLTLAIVAYYTAVQLSNKIDIIRNALFVTGRIAAAGYGLIMDVIAGKITRAAIAQQLLNLRIMANPYGLAAAALVGLVAWVVNIANRLSDAEKAQIRVNNEMKKAKDLSDQLRTSTQALVDTINDSNLTKFAQAKAFVELQEMYPKLLENMSLEEFQTKSSTESLLKLNKARDEQEKAILRSNYEKAVSDVKKLKEEYIGLEGAMGGNQSGGLAKRFYEVREQLALAEEKVKQYGKEVEILNKIEFNAKPLDEKLAYYNKIRDGILEQIKDLEKQEQIIKGMNNGWNTFQNYINGMKFDNLFFQLKNINSQIKALTPKTVNEINDEIKTVGDRRKFLQKNLDELVASYEKIGEKDLAARRQNLKERKRIQDQLDALDGRSPSSSGSKSNDKALREANKARLRELEQLKITNDAKLKEAGLFQKKVNEMTSDELYKKAEIEAEYQTKSNEINRKYNHSMQETTKVAQSELTKQAADQKKFRENLVDKTDPLLKQENDAYQKRLEQAGLFGKKREDMSEEQLAALQILENNHQSNINKIDADALDKHTDQVMEANKVELTDLRIKHLEELNQITTLAQAKEVLSSKLTEQELAQVRDLGQAKKLIRNQQDLEEQAVLRKQLEDLLVILQHTMDTGQLEGVNLADDILSDKEKEALKKRIQELREEIAKLKGVDLKDGFKTGEDKFAKTDILGMSKDDWLLLFKNIDTSQEGMLRLFGAIEAGISIWKQYNAYVAAGENAQLQKDEQANKKKKENLEARLKSGSITQEAYNKQIEFLDKDLENKKAKIAHDQAKRDKQVALMSAIVNTATAVTKALPNVVLAAIVGAMGALQVATILKTPVPAIEGREDGGTFVDVTRAQDNKPFKAKVQPNKRGFVDKPTVLVGESGREWVANDKLVTNPMTAPIIQWLDSVQRNGSIDTSMLSSVIKSTIPGRANGGTFNGSQPEQSPIVIDNTELKEMIMENSKAIVALNNSIKNGVSVNMLGPNGFLERQAELETIQKNSSL